MFELFKRFIRISFLGCSHRKDKWRPIEVEILVVDGGYDCKVTVISLWATRCLSVNVAKPFHLHKMEFVEMARVVSPLGMISYLLLAQFLTFVAVVQTFGHSSRQRSAMAKLFILEPSSEDFSR